MTTSRQRRRASSATITAARIATAERCAKALDLRRRGHTYQQIADQLGYSDRSNARRDVMVAFDGITAEPARETLAAELSRLDAMLGALWPAASRGRVTAVDRVLKIMERRARYLGLDSPIQHVLTGDTEGGPVRVATDPASAREAALASIAAIGARSARTGVQGPAA